MIARGDPCVNAAPARGVTPNPGSAGVSPAAPPKAAKDRAVTYGRWAQHRGGRPTRLLRSRCRRDACAPITASQGRGSHPPPARLVRLGRRRVNPPEEGKPAAGRTQSSCLSRGYAVRPRPRILGTSPPCSGCWRSWARRSSHPRAR